MDYIRNLPDRILQRVEEYVARKQRIKYLAGNSTVANLEALITQDLRKLRERNYSSQINDLREEVWNCLGALKLQRKTDSEARRIYRDLKKAAKNKL